MVCYATREAVKDSLEINRTAFANSVIDRMLRASGDTIEALTHRRFYPEIRTQTFDWPNQQYAPTWTFYLESHELIELTALTAGGTSIDLANVLLRPDTGPPYTRIELSLDSNAVFQSGDTWQRAISATGLFGYNDQRMSAATLETSINASSTVLDLSPVDNALPVGVGSLLMIDSERIELTNRRMIDTTVDTGGALTASMADSIISVADSSVFAIGETLLIDSERMYIVDIAGNNLVAKRAWDGSVLAAHSAGADIYAARRFIGVRGALGTTAASHDAGTTVEVQVYPGKVIELAIAETVVALEQNASAYARTIGSGDNVREARGIGLEDVRSEVVRAYGRKSRKRAV